MKILICICLVLTVYALGGNWAQGHWTRGQWGGSSWTPRTLNHGGTQSSAGKMGCTHRYRSYWGNGNRGDNYWGGGYWSRSHRGGDGWRINHWDSSRGLGGRRLIPNYNKQFRNYFGSGYPLTRPTYNHNGEFISKIRVVLTPKSSETINETTPNIMAFDNEFRRGMKPKTTIQTFANESQSKQETIHIIGNDSNRFNNTFRRGTKPKTIIQTFANGSHSKQETIHNIGNDSNRLNNKFRRGMEPKTPIQTFANESHSKQETIHNIGNNSNRLNTTDMVDIIKTDSPQSKVGVAVTEKMYLQEPYDPFSDYVEVE